MPYGTDEGFQQWLDEQGYTLVDDAPALPVLRARGSAYVDGYEAFWTGSRSGGVMQDQAWPRTGASVNCVLPVPDGVIPPAIVRASYRAAWLEGSTPGILAGPTITAGARVKREKVDVVEAEYFDDKRLEVGGGPGFIDSMIDGLLRQFICDQSGGAFVWSLGR